MSLGKQAKGVIWEKGKNWQPLGLTKSIPHPRLVLLETRSKCLEMG